MNLPIPDPHLPAGLRAGSEDPRPIWSGSSLAITPKVLDQCTELFGERHLADLCATANDDGVDVRKLGEWVLSKWAEVLADHFASEI